ncbi:MAG TPA: hypothetical protein VFP09_01395 [Desertimonas sp.]|nr:hypothetical protein [Desertimonas sp.]
MGVQAAASIEESDGSPASLAAAIAAHRGNRQDSPLLLAELPPEVRDRPHGMAAEDAALEAALAAAEQAIAVGDAGAAAVALDQYIFHLVKAANTFAVAGARCGTADPARAARAALNVPLDISPLNATAGFGSVLVTEHNGRHVVRVDPDTGQVLATIDAGVEPVKLQPADGRMWGRAADAFFAIDPATNIVTATLPKSDVGPAADRVWAVDGGLWIGDGLRLHRYDTATLHRVAVVELGMPCDLPAGTSELIVVSTYNGEPGQSGAAAAAFVDPGTNAVLATIAVPVDVTIGVVLDDAVFLAGESGSKAVVVDRATWTVSRTPDLGRDTGALGTGETDGTSVYVPTLDQRDVLVVDASTFAVTDVVETLGVHCVTVQDDSLWVAGYDGYVPAVRPQVVARALLVSAPIDRCDRAAPRIGRGMWGGRCRGDRVVTSEQADGAVRGIDLDLGAVGDAGGGSVGADHRCQTELACHGRGVAQRSALFHDESADHGQQRVHRGPGERRDQHVARLELVESEHQVAHHARPPGVDGVADADPVHGG